MRGDAMARISDVAAVQWGLITSRQAASLGVSRWDISRLAGDTALQQVGFGVYRVSGAPPTELLELKVAWLQLDPETVTEDRVPGSGVVSHASAAVVLGVGDFEPDRHEFTRPARFRSRRTDVSVHVDSVDPAEVRLVDQMLVTGPGWLARDLLAQRYDGGHVGQVFVDLLAKRLITENELAAAVGPYARAYGLAAGDGPGLVTHLSSLVASSPDTSMRRAA